MSIYSLTHYAKGTPLEWKVLNNEAQKRTQSLLSRCSDLACFVLRLIVCIGFQVFYCTPFLRVLFTFPSRYLYAIGHWGILRLRDLWRLCKLIHNQWRFYNKNKSLQVEGQLIPTNHDHPTWGIIDVIFGVDMSKTISLLASICLTSFHLPDRWVLLAHWYFSVTYYLEVLN